jgi:hypothetical protein
LVNIGKTVDPKDYEMADKEWAELTEEKKLGKIAELIEAKKKAKKSDSKPSKPEQKAELGSKHLKPEQKTEPGSKPPKPESKNAKTKSSPKPFRRKSKATKASQKPKAHKKKAVKLRPKSATLKKRTGKVCSKPDLSAKTVKHPSNKDKPKPLSPPFKKLLDAKLKVHKALKKPILREPGKRHLKAPGSSTAQSLEPAHSGLSLPSSSPPYHKPKSSTSKTLVK